jgi:glutamate N-acetyltransferase / amino-acid N-acetyltransferase
VTFFDSRFVERPPHVTERDKGLPDGFSGAGVAAGIKPSGRPDVALLFAPEGTTSAARFTRSGTAAAPVLLTRDHSDLAGLRGIVANAGCANAATGAKGFEDASRMRLLAAETLGLSVAEVAVCSTGGISDFLPMERIEAGIAAAAGELAHDDGDVRLSNAIQTTDAFEKRAALDVELPSGTVRLCGQAKGAGMIQPGFATMFCFVQTDAALRPETAELLLSVCVQRSFDRISVDGQMSTNDTAILMAGGTGVRIEPESEDELRFGEALDALLRQLAVLIVRDGEGARRIGRVVVRGGHEASVEGAARAVANSPLVKAALHGGDPNWGRIAQSVGMALPDTSPLPFDIAIEGVQVCSAGAVIPYDEAALAQAVAGAEVEYEIGLPGEGVETEVFFSDLSYDYVRINAEYTT